MSSFLRKIVYAYSNKFVSRWLVLAIDLAFICFSFLFANLLFSTLGVKWVSWGDFLFQIPYIGFLFLVASFYFQSFAGVIRHTSLEDGYRIFKAVTVTTIILSAVTILIRQTLSPNKEFIPKPFSYFEVKFRVIFVHYVLSLFILLVSRLVFKALYNYFIDSKKNTSIGVLIFGAGESGLMTKNTLLKNKSLGYKVVGFIDDNPSKAGKALEGIMVYPTSDISEVLMQKLDVSVAIISVQNIHGARKREIVDRFLNLNVDVKMIPPVEKWMHGELNVSQIKNVKIEDLLGRDPIRLDSQHVQASLNQKVIMVTGGAGSIGSEIVRQVLHYNPKFVVVLDQAESALYDLEFELKQKGYNGNFKAIVGDVGKLSRLRQIFEEFRPNIIFHAAAYKHVPLMEENPFEAIAVNIFGSRKVADLAVEYGVEKFVMVSTDKAVNPTNVMGASKRAAEMYTQALNFRQNTTRFITTRFGNVLGSNGSVIPLFKKQIEAGGPITVTHQDITRYFMTIPEACELVLEAGSMGNGGEIFIFDMGESVKIIDLAKKMIRLSGLQLGVDIDIKITGLRPGEKLYEELLNNEENTQKTHHPKIMIANVQDVDFELLQSKLSFLKSTTTTGNDFEMVKGLKEIVPEFISNNSVFESLDAAKVN